MLDRLRWIFPYTIAFLFPPSGLLLAGIRYSEGERDDVVWLVAAAVLGAVGLYVPLFLL
jgi:hypothetical protein